MGGLNVKVDIQKLLSFGDDLIKLLNSKKDAESLMQSMESQKIVYAAAREDAEEIHASLEEYQKKISSCKESIDKTRSETIADAEIEHLQNELEEKLQRESLLCQELREIHEEIDGLEHQRTSIEERKELVKKREKDLLRAQNLLSMCASVTKIIPNLDDETMISGWLALISRDICTSASYALHITFSLTKFSVVVDRNRKRAEKFVLDTSLPPHEASNRLWKMASSG